MAENEIKTKRQMLDERLKAKYPEKSYADNEAMYGQINDDYDQYEKQLGEYKDREQKMLDVFEKDKRGARFLSDMARGEDPFVAMIERMGIDGITDVLNDPEKKDIYAEANKKYLEAVAKSNSLEEEYNQNFEESMARIEAMKQQRGLSDEVIDEAFDWLHKVTDEVIMGKFTEETISMALKAISHDADVANARTEGTIAGRNAKIDEQVRKPKAGDGMPNMAGTNNGIRQPRQNRSMFDLAQEAR